jgi:hypothetical protein
MFSRSKAFCLISVLVAGSLTGVPLLFNTSERLPVEAGPLRDPIFKPRPRQARGIPPRLDDKENASRKLYLGSLEPLKWDRVTSFDKLASVATANYLAWDTEAFPDDTAGTLTRVYEVILLLDQVRAAPRGSKAQKMHLRQLYYKGVGQFKDVQAALNKQ